MMDVETAFRESALFQELERIFATEDSAYFESKAKRQHFIPQLMLRRFAREVNRKLFLYQLDVRTGAPRRMPIEAAASRRYYYSLTDEAGARNNRVEGFLSLVESYAAPALEQLLVAPDSVPDGDRATLAFFFALLDPRTPGGTERMIGLNANGMRMLLANDLADPERFATSYRHIFGEADTAEIEAFRGRTLRMLEAGEIAFSDPKAHALQLGFGAAGSVAAVIYQMEWTIMRSRAHGFVTSDRGLAMHDPTPKYPWSGAAWGSSASVQVTIPLATSACLMLHFDADVPTEVDVDQEAVDLINLRTYGWAEGYIYGESQALVAAVRRLAKTKRQHVVRPTPHHQVLLFEADEADSSVADANARRGWPPYLVTDGRKHDYYVIGPSDNAAAISSRVSQIVKERAARKMGLPPGTRPRGRSETEPVHPFDLEGVADD